MSIARAPAVARIAADAIRKRCGTRVRRFCVEIAQGVEVGRPSKLYARVEGSADEVERVEVGGSAVIVARGELKV